jgi:glucosamine--fructose-6-phosphate aminotransferase (isomerizing)
MTKWRMLDYIREQPAAVANTLRTCQPGLTELRDFVTSAQPRRVLIAGLGSSYTAAQIAAPALRTCLPVPSIITVASEAGVDRSLPLDPETLVVLVSRSGERGGIVDALEAARQAGAPCVAVTAVGSSLLATDSDLVIVTGEGTESAYPKTKSVTATAVALMELGMALDADVQRQARLEVTLAALPEFMESGIRTAEHDIEALAAELNDHDSALVTGTAGNQGVAQEAALKLQEAAQIVTEWEETGSAIHGAVTILSPGWLHLALVTPADYEMNVSLLRLATHFGAYRLCIAPPGLDLDGSSDSTIRIPEVLEPVVAPLLYLPPLQLITYHLTVGRGLNPDEPAYAEVMLKAMLPDGREEPDWGLTVV